MNWRELQKLRATKSYGLKAKYVVEHAGHCAVCPASPLEAHHWYTPFYSLSYEKALNAPTEWMVALCKFHHDLITNENHRAINSKKKPEPENYKDIVPRARREVKKHEEIEYEDYRRITPIDAQRTDRRPVKQILEGY